MKTLPVLQLSSQQNQPASRKISDSTTDSSPRSDYSFEQSNEKKLPNQFFDKCYTGSITCPTSTETLPHQSKHSSQNGPINNVKTKNSLSIKRPSLEDYKIKKLLGTGAYSKVALAYIRGSNNPCALKILEKAFIEKV